MTSILFFEFLVLLLVLVILMMDHIVFIELRIILVMDHVGVEVRVRVYLNHASFMFKCWILIILSEIL